MALDSSKSISVDPIPSQIISFPSSIIIYSKIYTLSIGNMMIIYLWIVHLYNTQISYENI